MTNSRQQTAAEKALNEIIQADPAAVKATFKKAFFAFISSENYTEQANKVIENDAFHLRILGDYIEAIDRERKV